MISTSACVSCIYEIVGPVTLGTIIEVDEKLLLAKSRKFLRQIDQFITKIGFAFSLILKLGSNPGFDAILWVEFVVGSLPWSERFFSG